MYCIVLCIYYSPPPSPTVTMHSEQCRRKSFDDAQFMIALFAGTKRVLGSERNLYARKIHKIYISSSPRQEYETKGETFHEI